jgi:singapore isolate B (sub-type 7) whole genome shotgun sequence assembly, scaffold_1
MQVLREYKGNNASSKMSPKEGTDEKRIIFIDVIPYPTLLFESRSTIESVM